MMMTMMLTMICIDECTTRTIFRTVGHLKSRLLAK